MKEKYFLLLLFAIMVSPQATAANWYVGLGFGQSEIDQGFFGEYGDGFKVFGGLQLNRNVAVEAAYIDYGSPSENVFGADTKYEATAVAAWAKGLWPVFSRIDLFGKVGLAYWEVDSKSTLFGFPSSTTSDDGIDLSWGIGTSLNYWDKLSIQLEYEDILADIDAITLWSISAVYKF